MKNIVKNIVILGGGSAGWLSAGVLAADHKSASEQGISITLIESPDVKTIGVGEGTWPTMRDTLRKIGISETEFLIGCDASFKQGSKFIKWVDGREEDFYYHPFVLPQDFAERDLVPFWQSEMSNSSFADTVSIQSHLCAYGRAPKQIITPEYAAVANYAYHLDAGKFAELLKKHCTEKLGVKYIHDHVKGVKSTVDGDIASLSTEENGDIQGDLFIDCSGSASLLLGEHYAVPFECKKDVLFNDTALAVQVPYQNENDPIASPTLSTAQAAGWIWDIGLSSRRGVGYVFSSAHETIENAEQTLRNYLEPTLGKDKAEKETLRKISFNPGHRKKFWHKNCVAIGMAAGFLEPLEASALVLVELSVAMISADLPANREMMDFAARRFNERFLYRWDRIIDFLKLHYILSNRTDSKYWTDNRKVETIPERLQDLLTFWKFQPPSANDLTQIEEIFPAASYQYILYGMGFKTERRQTERRLSDFEDAFKSINENAALVKKYLAGLPSNRELIDNIKQHGISKI